MVVISSIVMQRDFQFFEKWFCVVGLFVVCADPQQTKAFKCREMTVTSEATGKTLVRDSILRFVLDFTNYQT